MKRKQRDLIEMPQQFVKLTRKAIAFAFVGYLIKEIREEATEQGDYTK